MSFGVRNRQTARRRLDQRGRSIFLLMVGLAIVLTSIVTVVAQKPSETPPPPGEPRPIRIPTVEEFTLRNGLRIAVVSKTDLPLVTVSLLVRSGSSSEDPRYAGLARITASLLTKGTALRSASEIAQEIDFLGASINTGAGWNSSTVTLSVMSDNLPRALSIMSDSVVRPTFPAKEIRLVKKQTLDGLSVNLKRPGTVLAYVAGRFTYGEHSTTGTPQTVRRIRGRRIVDFHRTHYVPENAVLVFTGDISGERAKGLGRLFFGGWTGTDEALALPEESDNGETGDGPGTDKVIGRMLVVDLPDSGQAAVGYAKRLEAGRVTCGEDDAGSQRCSSSGIYFPATVLNSVLGGSYSARLNQEIRIKRGLSYGARSGFSWRRGDTNFNANTQTKNESAAEVAELIRIEIEKLTKSAVTGKEIKPRKAVVSGGFSRGLQTNAGLAARIRDLYLYNVTAKELNSYINNVTSVTGEQIRSFAVASLRGGDLIIVGDAKLFMDDLTKRFPNQTIEVIRSKDLDLNRPGLRRR